MKITSTITCKIDEAELKSIIVKHFAATYGRFINEREVQLIIKHTPYCEPELDYVEVEIEDTPIDESQFSESNTNPAEIAVLKSTMSDGISTEGTVLGTVMTCCKTAMNEIQEKRKN